MKAIFRVLLAFCFVVTMSVMTTADQLPRLSRVMRAKMGHAQAILAGVITNEWGVLDRESRALALAVRDPAWIAALTGPEYMPPERCILASPSGSHRGIGPARSRRRRQCTNRADDDVRALPRLYVSTPHREVGLAFGT